MRHTHTATFIGVMDKIFDIFNSFTGPNEFNKPFCNNENQRPFLEAAKTYLKSIWVISKKGENITNKVFTFNAWIHNINALQQLWLDIQNNFPEIQFLMMRKFNQDGIENLFGKIRILNGNARNSTSTQFYHSLRKSFSGEFFDDITTGNCAPD